MIGARVRGLKALRAFVFRTVNAPNPGIPKRPLAFSSFTMACTTSLATR